MDTDETQPTDDEWMHLVSAAAEASEGLHALGRFLTERGAAMPIVPEAPSANEPEEGPA